ncbi:trypsin-like peptidase domain-containing protein [Streptomyces sp. NPDC006326]|uniref:nSTAND1 domain-containing NTPase n=1 Tax=Streptomyces sp. NPDC006326 TaxID=3156752 RepID=UPI0033BC20A7
MTWELRTGARSPDAALAAAAVRVTDEDGNVGGAGFLVAPDLVLTCAHVVSDALGRPRDEEQAGSTVTVDLPLDENAAAADGPRRWPAVVERWVPIRPGRIGDIALLRLREPVPGAQPLRMADPHSVLEHGALAVGFTGGEPAETWFRGRFGGATSEGWLQLSRADGESAHIRRGFSGSPVWDGELGAVVGLMVAAQPEQDAQLGYVLRTRAILREIPELARIVLPPSPFPGLEPFRESDQDAYFGRSEDVESVVTALKGDQRVVAVYGPSGCGKSSLALAGVVPRMRADGYEVLTLNAGQISSPRAALATELSRTAPAADPDTVTRWLADIGLADTYHRVGDRTDGKLLVVLDQAEALLGDDSEAKMDECADLLFARRSPGSALRVLVVLRSDFMDAVLKHPRLGPALHDGTAVPLTPMTREQLEEAITKPLERIPAVAYDPGLDRRILDDTGGDPGILPLLGFVLRQLWERQAGGRLPAAAYEAMGGVSGALEAHSEAAWKACVEGREEVEQEALRLLTGLVRMLPGGTMPLRRRLSRQEAGEARWRIAQSLAERRLLVLYGGKGEPETAELAHESLISTWPTLRQRVQEDAEFLAARAELGHDRDRWERDGRPVGLLPTARHLLVLGSRLHGRESELGGGDREFLDLARRHRRRLRNRVVAAWIAASVALALLAGLGTFLVYQSGVTALRTAEGRSRSLAALSDGLVETDPGLASLASLAAYQVSPTQEARNAMLRRYDALQDVAWVLTGSQGGIATVAMSSRGEVTLLTSDRGRATLFVRTPDGRTTVRQLNLAGNATSPAVSRDGRRIAYVSEQTGSLVWHEVHPGAADVLGPAHPLRGGEIKEVTLGVTMGEHHNAAFSPSGDQVVVLASDRRPRVWDLRTGQLRKLPDAMPALLQVWFGPDEDTLVAQEDSRPQELYHRSLAVDLRTGTVRGLTEPGHLQDIAVSENGKVVAVCQREGKDTDGDKAVYRIVDVADGRELSRYTPSGSYTSCENTAFDATGEHIAVRDAGDWTLLDTRSGKAGKHLSGPTEKAAAHLALMGSPDEPVLVTRTKSAVTGSRLWESDGATTFSPPQLLDHGNAMVVRVGRDGDRLRILETSARGKTLAEVKTDAKTPPSAKQVLQVNRAQTLVADVADTNRIVLRALPDLHKVAEFKAAEPPAGKDGKPALLDFAFLGNSDMVTRSGTLIEHWNAENGQRLAPALDVGDLLRRDGGEPAQFFIGRHPRPGFVQVVVENDPVAHAFDLRTGKEDKGLRIDMDRRDVLTLARDADGQHAMVLTSGSLIELWSVRDGQRAHRVQGPFGPLVSNRWTAGGLPGSGFFLANGTSVLFLHGDDPVRNDSYDLGKQQGFLSGTDGGRAILLNPVDGGQMRLLRLDPELWKRHLCAVLGRDLAQEERTGLPKGLPRHVCPA